MDRARQAGWHMRGRTAFPFVSLVEDPSKLVDSRDHWARAIAQSTNALHTYTVPRSAVWTPDDVLSSIGLGMNVEDQHNIDADVDLMCALGRTPTPETERLFWAAISTTTGPPATQIRTSAMAMIRRPPARSLSVSAFMLKR